MQITIIVDPQNPTDGSNDLQPDNLLHDGNSPPQEMQSATMLQGVLKGDIPLPPATRSDSRLMHHVAALMHSSSRHGHKLAATFLPGSLFLKTPGIIVHATASEAPLFLGEAEVVAISTSYPVLLLRRAADGLSTVDVALPSLSDLIWLFEYRLFRSLGGDSWLVPPGSGPSIQLMRQGLFLSDHAPYANHWDYDAGLERASAHLASHRIGGWSW